MFSDVFAGNTVSMCALNATYRLPKPGCTPNTLPTSSMRTSSSPTSRKRSASHAPRADSPNGGAAIRAISICQWANCGSCVRNQLNADRTSGEADRRATSCCSEGARSGMSARGGVGLIGSYCAILQRMGRGWGLANTARACERLYEKLVDLLDRLCQPTRRVPGNLNPGQFPLRQRFLESRRHPLADGFAVSQPILHEGDVAIGEQIEIVTVRRCNRFHFRRAYSKVALVPEAGGQAVGSAIQYAVRFACQMVLEALLPVRDLGEFLSAPLIGPQVQAFDLHLFAVFATVLGNAHRVVMLSQFARQSRRSRRLRADHAHPFRKIRSHTRLEILPISQWSRAQNAPRDRNLLSLPVHHDMAAAQKPRISFAIIFRR